MMYRREIDGLRAVAVVPVILFHGEIPRVSGGFVGVDVFFVISGYLISSIIMAELHNGTFSLVKFYERRARRILPALLLVMLSFLIFAYALLLPSEMKTFGQSVLSVCAFVSNIFFWRYSGYFDVPAHSQILLHTWSLSVEEQYYLLSPACLILIWRLGLRWVAGVTIGIAFISLFASQAFVASKPAAAFYLFPMRAFELMIGATTAILLFNKSNGNRIKLNPFVNEALSIVGLLLICYSVFSFDNNTHFPGVSALIPTIGTALLIVFADDQTYMGRLLGQKIFVGIGLISYSAYLWHWPLFVVARLLGDAAPSISVSLSLAAVSFGLAFLSWKYVEYPFRRVYSRKTIIIALSVPTAALIAFSLAAISTQGFASRFTDEQLRVLAFSEFSYMQIYAEGGGCFLPRERGAEAFTPPCNGAARRTHNTNQDNQAARSFSVLSWGDSSAAALSRGIRQFVPDLMQFTSIACPPLVGLVLTYSYNCKDINDFVLRQIELLKPDKIIMHARWASYSGQELTLLENTVTAVRRVSPSSAVIIVGNVPYWHLRLPILMAREHVSLDSQTYLRHRGLSQSRILDEQIRAMAARNGVLFFSAFDAFCVQDACRTTAVLDGQAQPMTWDQFHLTVAGAATLACDLLLSVGVNIDKSASLRVGGCKHL